eukprot:TRINITY_DN1064_c1_g2_i1.p1 TRINITY_DN1064_c1_g2~~TRINITY_DN1064_c1_g2_i1.p1  ORF type:complete len:134 (+),score=42.45 TRINITY_DN1064_c1_g2_i1:48-449(+)
MESGGIFVEQSSEIAPLILGTDLGMQRFVNKSVRIIGSVTDLAGNVVTATSLDGKSFYVDMKMPDTVSNIMMFEGTVRQPMGGSDHGLARLQDHGLTVCLCEFEEDGSKAKEVHNDTVKLTRSFPEVFGELSC